MYRNTKLSKPLSLYACERAKLEVMYWKSVVHMRQVLTYLLSPISLYRSAVNSQD
jgi:hypothetical protein